jgi:hypothetical protein
VDVWSLDTVPGTGELVGDLGNPFLEPGTKWGEVGTPTVFRLIPIVEDGWTVEPEFVDVLVPVCSTSTLDPTTTAPVLPFTGLSTVMWATLVFAGAVSAVLGFVLVMSTRDE